MLDKIEQHIPKFEPYSKLIVGSNEVTCTYLVRIAGFVPLVIGKGKDMPLLWMYALNDGKVYSVVVANTSLTKNIGVQLDTFNHTIKVYFRNSQGKITKILFSAEYTDSEFRILEMDLHFLGINIQSDEKSLLAGRNKIKDNFVHGVEAFIGG